MVKKHWMSSLASGQTKSSNQHGDQRDAMPSLSELTHSHNVGASGECERSKPSSSSRNGLDITNSEEMHDSHDEKTNGEVQRVPKTRSTFAVAKPPFADKKKGTSDKVNGNACEGSISPSTCVVLASSRSTRASITDDSEQRDAVNTLTQKYLITKAPNSMKMKESNSKRNGKRKIQTDGKEDLNCDKDTCEEQGDGGSTEEKRFVEPKKVLQHLFWDVPCMSILDHYIYSDEDMHKLLCDFIPKKNKLKALNRPGGTRTNKNWIVDNALGETLLDIGSHINIKIKRENTVAQTRTIFAKTKKKMLHEFQSTAELLTNFRKRLGVIPSIYWCLPSIHVFGLLIHLHNVPNSAAANQIWISTFSDLIDQHHSLPIDFIHRFFNIYNLNTNSNIFSNINLLHQNNKIIQMNSSGNVNSKRQLDKSNTFKQFSDLLHIRISNNLKSSIELLNSMIECPLTKDVIENTVLYDLGVIIRDRYISKIEPRFYESVLNLVITQMKDIQHSLMYKQLQKEDNDEAILGKSQRKVDSNSNYSKEDIHTILWSQQQYLQGFERELNAGYSDVNDGFEQSSFHEFIVKFKSTILLSEMKISTDQAEVECSILRARITDQLTEKGGNESRKKQKNQRSR